MFIYLIQEFKEAASPPPFCSTQQEAATNLLAVPELMVHLTHKYLLMA